ncbi:MAG TPA: lysophospholipid acyltransferase family protein [Acidimicrobiia bacterium]|nr:lysophospholipid acyltransferase family protein [Acidimicrobiia bacterium]
MKRIVDWIFTVPFLIAFGLTLAIFDPIARVARLFGLRPMEITMGVMQLVLLGVFRICGTRLKVERSPAIRPRTGYLIVSNHQSLFDVPIFGGLLFSNYPKYISKRELGRWLPSISFNLQRGGNALIDRNDPEQAKQAIRELGEAAQRRNVAVVIYPEGTRSRNGQLKRFKFGGALELMQAAPDLELIPATIDGSWELLRNKAYPIPFGTRVRVRFGDPIPRRPDEDRRQVLQTVRGEIEATIEEWRRGS